MENWIKVSEIYIEMDNSRYLASYSDLKCSISIYKSKLFTN
jgi:hypothetical protein